MILRDYQEQAVIDLRRSISYGNRSPLYVLPPGGGKSAIATTLMSSAVAKGRRALFIAPRRQLVYQISEDLDRMGVDHGLIMSGEDRAYGPPVSVASLDTLYSRLDHAPGADLIVVDEAHCVFGKKARLVFEHYRDAIRIGFTATPARSDGRGLGELYDDMVLGPQMPELIERGYLVPCRYMSSPTKIDLSDVRMSGGDYNQTQLGRKAQDPVLIGDVVENWLRTCPDRQTVVFAVDRAHALSLQREFLAAGVEADYIDGNTPTEERHRVIGRLENCVSRVLCSVDVLSYGWDCPIVSCGILARPTRSLPRYIQAAGRILRAYPGKKDAILIDHGQTVHDLGFVDDDHPWTLDGERKVQDEQKLQRVKNLEPDPMECPYCHVVQDPSPTCESCGESMRRQYARAIETVETELAEIDRKTKAARKREWSHEDKQTFLNELRQHALDKGYNLGWAAHKFKAKFGVFPRRYEHGFAEISPATRRWIKSQQIRAAKRREKERAGAG